MDDTDNLESRGTGRLAREIASALAVDFNFLGVTRHQLLVDPRVPYTSHNSSAAILLESSQEVEPGEVFEFVRRMMISDFQTGSDPGLCVAVGTVPPEIIDFGRRAQKELVTQAEARQLATRHDVLLAGLGGTQDGVIGSLAAIGLAASGNDGRYLLLGKIREISGPQPVMAVLEAGVASVQTIHGVPVEQGLVLADKLRPARRNGLPVQFVESQDEYWQPLKLD
jgi:hypothetical protein